MDKETLEKLKKENEVDNSILEDLIKQEISPEMQKEVFKVLKESRLFLPVDYGPDVFIDLENKKPGDEIEGPRGFNILFLTDDNGNKAVPLFTSEKMMEKAGAHSSVMVIYMSDLADMLKQTDKYSIIAINPFTGFDLNIPIGPFLNLFDDDKPEITDVNNDRLRELLQQNDLSDDELKEFGEELLSSILITGCVDGDNGTSFVLISNEDNKPHLPLFSDLDEFKKIFSNYKEDVYPQAFHLTDLINVVNEDFVLNPASESLIFNPEMFKMIQDKSE